MGVDCLAQTPVAGRRLTWSLVSVPQLRVFKNNEVRYVVGSDDVWMLTASIWADLWGPEASTLDLSGSSKRRKDGTADFLIWALPDELVSGDVIDIHFDAGTQSNPKGTLYRPHSRY